MRPAPQAWTDFEGLSWPVIKSTNRLKFKYPALRCHVFRRDEYGCRRCSACASYVPLDYDGRFTLSTNVLLPNGYFDVLVLDHIVTLRAGGRSVVSNLQTLCETCNKKKQREDKAAAAAYRERMVA